MDKSTKLFRTMIILWKWDDLNNTHDTVNVHKSEYDSIIRVNFNKHEPDKAIRYIINLIKNIKGSVFVFLHRNHNCNDKHVKTVLNEFIGIAHLNIKCFLFSEERDYIYYYVGKEGLLDGSGGFLHDRIKNISVLVKENGKTLGIKYKHFSRTWNYYDNEFYEKIKRLAFDLISAITLEGIPSSQKLTGEKWYEKLSLLNSYKSKCVWFRLKSLLEEYKNPNKNEKTELEALSGYERDKETSFYFDDASINLGEHHKKNVSSAYKELLNIFQPIMYKNTSKTISIIDMRNVFDELLKQLE